jgi:hypothetical protein
MVRAHPDPPVALRDCVGRIRGFSSAGRAPALQAGGRRFDPDNLHQIQEFKVKRINAAFAFDRLINWLFDL